MQRERYSLRGMYLVHWKQLRFDYYLGVSRIDWSRITNLFLFKIIAAYQFNEKHGFWILEFFLGIVGLLQVIDSFNNVYFIRIPVIVKLLLQ